MHSDSLTPTLKDTLIGIARADEEILSIVEHSDQTFTIAFANSVNSLLSASASSARVMLSADIGKPVEGREQEMMSVALAYNMLWEDNDGARIGLAGEDGDMVLLQDIAPRPGARDLDPETLQAAMTRFADIALWWSQFIPSRDPQAAQALTNLGTLGLRP